MKGGLKKDGLVVNDGGKDEVPVLMQPGASYVPRAVAEKYGVERIRKLSGVEEVVVVDEVLPKEKRRLCDMYDDGGVDIFDEASTLIAEVREALARGTKHYRKSDGKLLETEREILQALVNEGGLSFEPARTQV